MYTYDAYEMENVVVNLYQSNNPSKTWSGVTDAEGHVEFIEVYTIWVGKGVVTLLTFRVVVFDGVQFFIHFTNIYNI